jgi:hypothetical protein
MHAIGSVALQYGGMIQLFSLGPRAPSPATWATRFVQMNGIELFLVTLILGYTAGEGARGPSNNLILYLGGLGTLTAN